MSIPKLKMRKEDVQIAINRQFKKDIPNLMFPLNQHFDAVDNDGGCTFTIQEEFIGPSTYTAIGCAKLWDSSKTTSQMYEISLSVQVGVHDSSPIVTEIKINSCKKR